MLTHTHTYTNVTEQKNHPLTFLDTFGLISFSHKLMFDIYVILQVRGGGFFLTFLENVYMSNFYIVTVY